MEKIKDFFKTLRKKDFWEFIWQYIMHPIREIGKLNKEIKELKEEIAISDEDLRRIEQELSVEYNNRENNFNYHEYRNDNINEKHLPTYYNNISDMRGISKSFNLDTGEISHILNGVKFPEKSLKFTNEHKNVKGKDITIVTASVNGKLSICLDGNILLDGQPLEMNQNVKNRLSEQIKGLNGQNAKLSFANGEFSILPIVQDKDQKEAATENGPRNIRKEMALPQDEQDRLAQLAKESADRIEEENKHMQHENANTGKLIKEI